MIKIIFLDINGVIEPLSDEKVEITEEKLLYLCKKLENDFGIDFTKYGTGDIISVYYYWDREALSQLKRIVESTGAKIVISSYWKLDGVQMMKDFFTIFGLGEYVIDVTPDVFRDKIDRTPFKQLYNEPLGDRPLEILEYLRIHQDEIEEYVAIDDRNLSPFLDGHWVKTQSSLKEEDANKSIKILNRK